MNDLSPEYQKRLEKWRQSIPSVKGTIFQQKYINNYVPRRSDYGDELEDFEKKDRDAWTNERKNSPIYMEYR